MITAITPVTIVGHAFGLDPVKTIIWTHQGVFF